MTTIRQVTPRLPVSDLSRTLAFYRDQLGFLPTILWPEREPTFAILERDGARVGFFVPDPSRDLHPGNAELWIQVPDVLALHSDLARSLEVEWGPEIYSYGHREFGLRDPDGYLLVFSEPTGESPTTTEP